MMAGNVAASVVSGDLIVNGDNKANLIQVTELSGESVEGYRAGRDEDQWKIAVHLVCGDGQTCRSICSAATTM